MHHDSDAFWNDVNHTIRMSMIYYLAFLYIYKHNRRTNQIMAHISYSSWELTSQ